MADNFLLSLLSLPLLPIMVQARSVRSRFLARTHSLVNSILEMRGEIKEKWLPISSNNSTTHQVSERAGNTCANPLISTLVTWLASSSGGKPIICSSH